MDLGMDMVEVAKMTEIIERCIYLGFDQKALCDRLMDATDNKIPYEFIENTVNSMLYYDSIGDTEHFNEVLDGTYFRRQEEEYARNEQYQRELTAIINGKLEL